MGGLPVRRAQRILGPARGRTIRLGHGGSFAAAGAIGALAAALRLALVLTLAVVLVGLAEALALALVLALAAVLGAGGRHGGRGIGRRSCRGLGSRGRTSAAGETGNHSTHCRQSQ